MEEESYYVNFIESHNDKEKVKINFAKKYAEVGDLEKDQEFNNAQFKVSIYRFKIYPSIIKKKHSNPEKLEIIIKIEDKENNKFEAVITNLKIDRDNYIYDFKFEKKQILFIKKKPPSSLNLSHIQQFNIYKKYLRNKCIKDKNTKENDALILSTLKILEEDTDLDFISYLIILIESSKKVIKYNLKLFKQEIKNNKLDIDKNILSQIKENIDSWEADPDNLLSEINENENAKEDYKMRLITIIFYYNYLFHKTKADELIVNYNINRYIYIGLFTFPDLFYLTLSKEQIDDMIFIITDFNQLKYVLKYNTNVLDLLKSINDNINKILDLFSDIIKDYPVNRDKKQNIPQGYPYIDFVKFVNQSKDDNLKSISYQIRSIIKNNIDNDKYFFIQFDHSFFETYMDMFYHNNLDNLIIIRDLIKSLKMYDKTYEIKKDINKYIHETGIYLCSNKKMNNIDIVNLVKKDDYYLPGTKFLKEADSVVIFSKLDIENMNEEFLNEWKKVKWPIIFDTEYKRMAAEIIGLVKYFKYFHLLYELLITNDLKLEQGEKLMILLQDKYCSLYGEQYFNKGEEEHKQFVDDSADLIYYTDIKGSNIEELLAKKLFKVLSQELIIEIYMMVLTKYKKITILCETNLVDGILNGQSRTVQSFRLIYLLERCPNSKRLIADHLLDYILTDKDIFSREESENIKLIHGLLLNDLYDKDDPLFKEYKENNQKILDYITEKIDKYDIIYNDIKDFFVDKISEIAFKKRLLIIYLLDDDLSNQQFILISRRFNEITAKINDLKILIEDKKFFFENSNLISIEKIEKLIKNIEEHNLNYCKNNKEIEGYSQFIQEAKERIIKKESLIFMATYNRQKEVEKDEIERLKITESKMKSFISHLTNKNANDVEKDLLSIVKSLNLDEEKISKETNILMKIYKLEDENDKKVIINSLICLSYKEKIIHLITSIKNIIEITEVKKEALYNIINTIIKYLEKNDIVNTIQISIKILKIYSIDIFDENNKLNKILMKLYEHPDSIKFLFCTTVEECEKARETLNDKKLVNGLQQIIKFVKIIENKDEISKMRDKEIIQKINIGLNSNQEIISDSINDDEIFGVIDNFKNFQNNN